MHQIIAILAAAFGFLTGGHALQPQDATLPAGDIAPKAGSVHWVRPADATLPVGDIAPKAAISPIGM